MSGEKRDFQDEQKEDGTAGQPTTTNKPHGNKPEKDKGHNAQDDYKQD